MPTNSSIPVASTTRRKSSRRIEAIDTARGFAMLMVFVSHFSRMYFHNVGALQLHETVRWAARISTPAFVLLSGMMLGLLRHEHREDFAETRDKLVDRGLFLLLVCHPLIALSEVAVAVGSGHHASEPLLRQVFITDTIGVALIAGAFVAQRVGARDRLGLGAALLIVHWLGEVLFAPTGHSFLLVVREIFAGRAHDAVLAYGFPILPWFAVYLLGSGIGEVFARLRTRGDPWAPSKLSTRLGIAALGLSLLLKLSTYPLKALQHEGHETLVDRVLRLASVAEKLPPSAAFVLFYSGLALLAIGRTLALDAADAIEGREMGRVRAWAALVGRNSLVAFVLQFYVYYTGVYLLPKPPLWLSPLYLALTVAVLLVALRFCDTHRLNAYFSVGYHRVKLRQRHADGPAPALSSATRPPKRVGAAKHRSG